MSASLKNKSILLIITGSVAAYKCADLVRRLREQGATVRCVMTPAAEKFITPLLMASLSENQVYTDLWSLKDETEMGHIRLSREADIVVVAPASANIMAQLAQGLCDDLASTILMATDKPVVVVPAMNQMMWQNRATQKNAAVLRRRGIDILGPAHGDMACGETGDGRMVEVSEIIDYLEAWFQRTNALKGKRAIVTSGPTYEPIDPVRFIGNFSSGKQGYAIARALATAGAETTLITGPSHEIPPPNVDVIHVMTADEMLAATLDALPADIAICAAAVADWRPESSAKEKLKKGKGRPTITLVENKDILKTISHMSGKQRPKLVIGFAAETSNVEDYARKKLLEKKCDWIVANNVSAEAGTFGGTFNTVHLFKAHDKKITGDAWPKMTKHDVAFKLVSEIIDAFSKKKS
jgi:phosphopantothenoylcysteine decarboxylase/phosphopantothenate--cysteine ligase